MPAETRANQHVSVTRPASSRDDPQSVVNQRGGRIVLQGKWDRGSGIGDKQ